MSDEDELWPVIPSETVEDALADPALPSALFSRIVALTVAIAENPWLENSRPAVQGEPWRTLPIPGGGGIVEYRIDTEHHQVVLTRIFPF
ncbi:hypothetical protein ACIRYZ_38990 [Kitasatospora sp. NPDC101155]|uniref:hypothetical protein n=1 Tax=Kitasatospora sp. NPDC101155 TaxID=3364097 RepID=UPI00382E0FFC